MVILSKKNRFLDDFSPGRDCVALSMMLTGNPYDFKFQYDAYIDDFSLIVSP